MRIKVPDWVGAIALPGKNVTPVDGVVDLPDATALSLLEDPAFEALEPKPAPAPAPKPRKRRTTKS